jgi:hypothetical protein
LEKLPWLEYTGQTTPELIACKNSHSIDSLLCAFEWGIQAKAKAGPAGEGSLTDEERLVLAVMDLNREVNNGGYDQFFVNSSRRFVPIIVDSLQRIGCAATAAITERAITTLCLSALSAEAVYAAILTEHPGRDEILTACDKEFYRLDEIVTKLFNFVEAHQDQVQLIKGTQPPVRLALGELSNASKLYISLRFPKKPALSLDGVRQLAQELARQDSIAATDTEIEAAAVVYAFDRSLHAGDLTACEVLAPRAFELMREEEPMYVVLHRKWVEQLMGASQQEMADASTLAYLEYLKGCDQSDLRTQNYLRFWVPVLQKHRAALPKSIEFFTASFPERSLDEPLPPGPMPYRELKRALSRKPEKG